MHIHLNSGNDIETPAQMVETSFFRWRGSLVVRLLNVASLKKKKEKHTSKKKVAMFTFGETCVAVSVFHASHLLTAVHLICLYNTKLT